MRDVAVHPVPPDIFNQIRAQLIRAAMALRSGEPAILSYRFWDEREAAHYERALALQLWRFRLRLTLLSSQHGYVVYEVTSADSAPPRVCSGTRGRGRKKAREGRKAAALIQPSVTWLLRNPDVEPVPVSILMMRPRTRSRRGPKGDRMKLWRKRVEAVGWV